MPLPPLPETPTFPVYGLGGDFDGYRWWALWNDPTYLWTISLGHGNPNDGAWIDVTTERDSRPQSSSEGIETPVLHTAAINAALRLVDLSNTRGKARHELLDREMALLQEPTDGPLNLAGWDRTSTQVGNRSVLSQVRTLEDAWAIIIDLPPVAVSVSGSADQRYDDLVLEDVSRRLDDYERLP